jgi:hypothetical protein
MLSNTNEGACSKTHISVVAMMMMADSPQTSSYCPFGKWMNKETLISSLNMLTKQLAEEVGVKIKDVMQEATHDMALAKKMAAKMKAAKKTTKPKKERKKKETHDSIRKRLFVVYPT